MSEIIYALRRIAIKSSSEDMVLSLLDDLDDGIAEIADAVLLLKRHDAITEHADVDRAVQSARHSINVGRDRVANANASKVLDRDLTPLRGIRQGNVLLRNAIDASFRLSWRDNQFVLDVDGITTPVDARDVSVGETDGRQFFVVGDRVWPLDDAIAVTNPNAISEWPALMTRSGSVVRVRPA